MIKNYLKIAWRNLLKNKGFSAINIFGLAVGIACCLLITLYVTDEMSYDNYHEKGDRIFRLNNNIKFGGIEQFMSQTPDLLGPDLKKDYPQVENQVRLYSEGACLIKKTGTLNNIRDRVFL
jgi:putative ABC transport system permease protein